MAIIDDLTEADWQTIIDLNILQELENLYGILASVVSPNDAFTTKRETARARLRTLSPIIDAVWNSGAATADALLNP